MLMPSIFGESLFDDFLDDFAFPDIDKKLYGKHAPHIMKTDVKEKDNTYEVAIDLPGFKKDEIQIQLPDIHNSTLRISPMVQTLVYVMKGDMTYVNA